MFSTYTAKYVKIKSGYMGQLVEWPEVVTEGKTLEECRAMLQDALQEMIHAYRQQKKEIPPGYTNNKKTIPLKRHKFLDRITANELCKQAGLAPKF